LVLEFERLLKTIVDKIPIMQMTISSSMSVNPALIFNLFILFLL
jgi:hypothetical protein